MSHSILSRPGRVLAVGGILAVGGVWACGSDVLTGVDAPELTPASCDCDDGDPCTRDVCQPDGSCTHATDCDDGDPCTANDTCVDGACEGEPYSCDDDNPCTRDVCVGDGTCTHAYDELLCPEDLPPETITWRGYYDCPGAQGKTGLDLTTTRDQDTNEMSAIFAFYAHPDNPGVPSGSWLDEGYYDPDDNSMYLLAVEWIDKPFGWVMVGMEGWYDGPQQQVHGNILKGDGSPNPKCETFHLYRVP